MAGAPAAGEIEALGGGGEQEVLPGAVGAAPSGAEDAGGADAGAPGVAAGGAAAAGAAAEAEAAGAPLAAGVEVEGFDGSLLEAIAEGLVPSPPVMQFGAWVRWRAFEGRRLRTAEAIASSEAALWRDTMEAVHGENWRAAMRTRRATVAPAVEPPPSPRAGGALALAALIDTPPRGAGNASDATGAFSEGSWGPLADDEGRERFERDLGVTESMLDFERRLLRARAVMTLRRLPVADGVMEHAMRKARFAVAARSHPEGVAAALEARLHAVLDVESGEADLDVRALMELLQAARGGGSAREVVAGGAVGAGVSQSASPARPASPEVTGPTTPPPGLGGAPPPGLTQPAGAAAPQGDNALAAALSSLAGAIGQTRGHKSSTIQIKSN